MQKLTDLSEISGTGQGMLEAVLSGQTAPNKANRTLFITPVL